MVLVFCFFSCRYSLDTVQICVKTAAVKKAACMSIGKQEMMSFRRTTKHIWLAEISGGWGGTAAELGRSLRQKLIPMDP